MSGFRKFRSNTQRRRRSIEAVELGHFAGNLQRGLAAGFAQADPGIAPEGPRDPRDAASGPGDLPASREAVEIGPAPIAWLKPKRQETDN